MLTNIQDKVDFRHFRRPRRRRAQHLPDFCDRWLTARKILTRPHDTKFVYIDGEHIKCNHVKKTQLDAQLILSIFRQPVHVSSVPRPIIRRHNRMYTTDGTYYSFQTTVCCPGWIGPNPPRTTDIHLLVKRILSTNCCIHKVVPPDDGPRYARNMYRLTKYTKNKLCIKLVFFNTIISRCTVTKT
jgi:hypothetical protein